MSASKYAYGVARIRAKRAFMLKAEDYEAVLRAPTLHQAVAHIQSVSDIGRKLPQTTDVYELEKTLLTSFVELLESISKTVGGDAGNFLKSYFSRFEHETLKSILKGKYLGLLEEEVSLAAIPLGTYSGSLYSSMLSARSVEQAVDLIPNLELKALLREALKQAEDLKSPIPLESAVDRWLYDSLWRQAKRLGGEDGRWARHLTGLDVDIKNIMVLIRGKELNLQPSALEKLWIPISYRLNVDLKGLASQPLAGILQALSATYYGEAISPLAKGAVEVEKSLNMLWLRENEKAFLHYPFTLGSLLAFANVKYVELKDIRAMLISKALSIPASTTLQLITRFSERLST
ncbi:MAG: hypothetical protein DRJ68_04120 [Thermoprotei archaeon]|nr:MAG: hypothetical protein DRJ68_04120 [Thermoprotei archaeon]